MAQTKAVTSELTKYKGRYATTGTYTRIGNSGRTAVLRGRLYEDLGINIGAIGKLTDDQVRNSCKRLESLQKQIVKAQVYAQNAEQQAAALKELESIRLGLLRAGSKALVGMDKDLKSAAVLDQSHQNHMAAIAQSTQHSIAELQAKNRSTLELGTAGFTSRLQNIAALHRSQMSYVKRDGLSDRRTQLNGLAQGRAARQAALKASATEKFKEQNWMNYITGKGRAKKPSLLGGIFS